jgi:MFS family permease
MFLGLSILALGVPGTALAGWLADRFVMRGRGDGHLIVGIIYVTGVFICGFVGPIVPNLTASLVLIGGVGFFLFTWTGVPTALLQIITPVRMRGQVSAIYLFSTGIFGIGLGPTAVGAATDYIFGYDAAVGNSLFLVGGITLSASIAMLSSARSYMPKSSVDLTTLQAA